VCEYTRLSDPQYGSESARGEILRPTRLLCEMTEAEEKTSERRVTSGWQ